MRTALFTIISNNYFAYAQTLMESVAASAPGYERFVCIVDNLNKVDCNSLPECEVVAAESLDISGFDDMTVRYDVMELNTAVKPFMFEHLLNNRGFDRAIYLDPDIQVFEHLAEVDQLFDKGASAVLTPHLLRPLEDGLKPDDHAILQSGIYNLGFAAFSSCQEAHDFLAWWGRRLRFQGQSDVRNNLFTDQRWCDFAPSFLPRLAILRHPGYNVAYWNLATRSVTQGHDGKILVDESPLVFFHFSGLVAGRPYEVSKHQSRLAWDDLSDVCKALFVHYRASLTSHGWDVVRHTPYAYDERDGLILSAPIRSLYRHLFPFNGPDEPVDRRFIVNMCNEQLSRPLNAGDVVKTRLMQHVHDMRPDLQAAFDLSKAKGLQAYGRWFERTAVREYGLDEALTRQSLLRTAPGKKPGGAAPIMPNSGRSLAFRLWRKSRKRLREIGLWA